MCCQVRLPAQHAPCVAVRGWPHWWLLSTICSSPHPHFMATMCGRTNPNFPSTKVSPYAIPEPSVSCTAAKEYIARVYRKNEPYGFCLLPFKMGLPRQAGPATSINVGEQREMRQRFNARLAKIYTSLQTYPCQRLTADFTPVSPTKRSGNTTHNKLLERLSGAGLMKAFLTLEQASLDVPELGGPEHHVREYEGCAGSISTASGLHGRQNPSRLSLSETIDCEVRQQSKSSPLASPVPAPGWSVNWKLSGLHPMISPVKSACMNRFSSRFNLNGTQLGPAKLHVTHSKDERVS
jgi:hypothetical protein